MPAPDTALLEPGAPRLPGVSFQTVPPPRRDTLPRMDVAAFVGLASSGPIDVPVVVEDPDRFRDVFGGDPPLAFDPIDGTIRRGNLGAAVEAFFRAGGTRCWVVRVADRETAVTRQYRIPGVASRGQNGSYHRSGLWAASPGSWADELRLGSVLHARHLATADGAAVTVDDGNGNGESSPLDYRLTLDPSSGALGALGVLGEPAPRDLLDIEFGAGLHLFLFVGELVTPREVRGPGHWFETEPAVHAVSEDEAESDPRRQERIAVRQVELDLLAWRDEELVARLDGLAFHPDHPRFWGNLPDDDDLFERRYARAVPVRTPEEEALRRVAADPRFPFGGRVEPADEISLPVLVPDRPDFDLAHAAEDLEVEGFDATALARDGLATFDSRLFVDDDLRFATHATVRRLAERKLYVRGERLRGVHAVLPLTEVSLVAVPDLYLTGWDRRPLPVPATLDAPELAPLESSVEEDDELWRARWTEVEGAEEYLLEIDVTSGEGAGEFEQSVMLYRGPDTEATFDAAFDAASCGLGGLEALEQAGCPARWCLRVRALATAVEGPWSNVRCATIPLRDFGDCGPAPLEAPSVSTEDDVDGVRISWAVVGGEPGADRYLVQRSEDLDFFGARDLVVIKAADVPEGEDPAVVVTRSGDYRVRALRDLQDGPDNGPGGEEAGPWSAGVQIRREALQEFVLRTPVGESTGGPISDPAAEPATEDFPALLDVQRALLRFCAGRADLVAVLGLPRGFRRRETRRHVGFLRPGGGDPEPPTDPDAPTPVRGLTFGETRSLSYGALYHPWLGAVTMGLGSDRGDAVRFVSPEGAVCGLLARRARERGAWISAANLPLADVLALDPDLHADPAVASELLATGVNLLARRPRGFLSLGASTLGASTFRTERELSSLPVRRLMILLRRLALREGRREVFESNDTGFRLRMRHRFERLLSSLFVRGAFSGAEAAQAFQVVAGESVNPPQNLNLGRFVVELRVAPSQPLQFLRVRLVQSGPTELSLEEA